MGIWIVTKETILRSRMKIGRIRALTNATETGPVLLCATQDINKKGARLLYLQGSLLIPTTSNVHSTKKGNASITQTFIN
jgi:hypothetical protein